MSLARKIFLSFVLCIIVWLAGLAWFIAKIPLHEAALPNADAIVVLTGGSGRIEYGLTLLAEGKAKKLFISGVGTPMTAEALLRHSSPNLREQLAGREKDIALGHEAENTIGNAAETARWLKKENAKSILLVTANYHIPRSVLEFEEATDGIAIIPAPVFPDDLTLSNWWIDPDSRLLILLEYHKFVAAPLRHWLVEHTHHRA